ncbi:MAG: chorismate mutase [Nanoarchaeota archaeon]|nr:chorismate mutase [Nanoarchaeota archaeon]
MRTKGEVRTDLDDIDMKFFNLFSRRLELSREMAKIKGNNGEQTFDSEREKSMIEARIRAFPDLDKEEVRGFQKYLCDSGKREQERFREDYDF